MLIHRRRTSTGRTARARSLPCTPAAHQARTTCTLARSLTLAHPRPGGTVCASGKPAGFLSANPSDCHWALGEGARLVAVGSDIALVANSTRKLADDFKAFCAKLRPPLPPIGKV